MSPAAALWRALRGDGDPRRLRASRRASPAHPGAGSPSGTNPATAAACGFEVDSIPANDRGRVDLAAFDAKLGPDVAGIMITNPNTCGLFENDFARIAEDTHKVGGYVYADGANFNAIVGRVRPGDLGVDCMHINLHKTFSTPHGGGGPGSGPVVLSAALAPFAPLPYVVHGAGGFDRGAGRQREELRPSQGLPWPDGHVHPGALACVSRPWFRRAAPGCRRCGPQRQLHLMAALGGDPRPRVRGLHA